MAALKNRSTAILIAVIVVILGTFFGVHRSVNAETAKIEKQFKNGVTVTDSVTHSTYVQPSIQSQLDKRAQAALGLVALGSNMSDTTVKSRAAALRQAREDLLGMTGISRKYAANEFMQQAYVAFRDAYLGVAAGDDAAFKSYTATMDGAQSVIEKSAYNGQVSEFLRGTLGAFPVNFLKNLAFVRSPEYFGAEG